MYTYTSEMFRHFTPSCCGEAEQDFLQVSNICTLKVTQTNDNTNRTNFQRHNLEMRESNDESEHKDENIEDDDKEDDDTTKKPRTPT